MLSNIDIKDWEMLTIPLKLKELKVNDSFSLSGDDKVLKVLQVVNHIVFAECQGGVEEMQKIFALPKFMEVYPWVSKKNTNLKSTDS